MPRKLSALGAEARRFWSDSRGATAIVFTVMLGVMLLSVGAAVDVSRWLHARTTIESALDSAVLAGARALQLNPTDEAGAIAAAQRYYDQNIKSELRLDGDSVTFQIVEGRGGVTASGSAYINTAVLTLFGIDRMDVFGAPQAGFPTGQIGVFGGSDVEVALVLDVTGSMCPDGNGPCTSGPKMDGLKAAANDLIDIVVTGNSKSKTRVAVVPFSTRVRVGPDNGGGAMMKALTNLNPTWTGWFKECVSSSGGGGSEGGGNWSCNNYEVQHWVKVPILPCVTDRFYNTGWSYDLTDEAPGSGRWLNAHDGGRMTLSFDSSDTAPGNKTGQTPNDPASHWNYRNGGRCADVAESNEILPLTDDKSKLHQRINGLSAYGSTAGALGTAWGWYMLSPKWSALWTGSAAPGSYADTVGAGSKPPKLRKVAVIMSDGVYNTMRNWKDQDQQTVSNYAKQLCANMKASGIEIYTVAFALNELSGSERSIAEDTLRSCGTDVHHFYETLTTEHLREAFRDIALSLTGVYLSR